MRYTLVCRYRRWVGKPDPSGFSVFTVSSADKAWLDAEARRLAASGHRVLCVIAAGR